MKNLYLTITFISVTALLAVWAVGCGGDDEEATSSPTTTKPTTPTQQQPPPGEQPPAGRPRLPKGVVFFEAEVFDKAVSTPEKGGVKWDVKDDPKAMSGKYITPTGATRQAVTELIYHIPEIAESGQDWKLWMRVIFPKVGGEAADSFFWDLSLDGKKWPGKNEVIAGEDVPNYGWRGWKMKKGSDKGTQNWFKLLERESDIQIDVICLRSDGNVPNDAEYEAYKQAIQAQ